MPDPFNRACGVCAHACMDTHGDHQSCSRFYARRLRFLRTAPRATRGDAQEGFGSAKDVPPGAMAPKALESAPPFLRKVCVHACIERIKQ